ncbi:Succinate dehydrogenase cytochrome b558 subunit protein [Minicystis rosea]|nr:Succinate dehydrogenase cytochrome b558 subunit protein [Minicystis rosea]
MSTSGSFLRSRLGSFLAFAPLSFWTVHHLWQNLHAFRGAAAWEREVTEYSHPIAMWATFAVVLLPIVIHAAWGTWRVVTVRPNVVRYAYFDNLKFTLQRISAVGILLFIGAHLWLATIHPRLTTGRAEPFSDISHQMRHHLPTLVVYLLGTLGVAYHLANGLQTFAMSWGLVTRRRAFPVLDGLAVVLFVVLLVMSWAVIYALWNAGA